MTFLSKRGAEKSYISADRRFSLIMWRHYDFMYVRIGGMRNTKTNLPAGCFPYSYWHHSGLQYNPEVSIG